MIWKVPEGMSMVDAATYGVGFSTAAMVGAKVDVAHLTTVYLVPPGEPAPPREEESRRLGTLSAFDCSYV